MKNIFKQKDFKFPYQNIKFPGQHTEERILFITREGSIVLKIKLLSLLFISVIGIFLIITILKNFTLINLIYFIPIIGMIWVLFSIFIAWWIIKVYNKTLFIITTRRLTKFIHTTPWSRYQMSLGLDQIVDTGAYKKGWLQILTGLGYFVARSSAGAVKNFKIINVGFSEDLHNYVNKLLYVFNDKKGDLDRFRPFIPNLKGIERDDYVRKVAPQFSKPILKDPPVLEDNRTQYLT